MGISFEQALRESDGTLFVITLATNQDDGVVGFASGRAKLNKATLALRGFGGGATHDTISTMGGEDLDVLFSDRLARGSQPFNVETPERLILRLTFGYGTPTVDLRIPAWSSQNFYFAVSSSSDLLVGIGPSLSGESPNAVYTLSLRESNPQPR